MPYLVALVALAQAHAAMGVTVRAQLERGNIILGDSVAMQIIVSNSSGGAISAGVPRVDGLEIRRSGSGWRFENGRRSDILNYVVVPAREGRFVIPAITVRVGQQTLRTNQVVLVVGRSPETGAKMRLIASVSKRECYVLEPVDVTFKVYITSGVRRNNIEMNIPLLDDKDKLSLKLAPPSRPIEPIVANRYELQAGRSSERLDGVDYTVCSFTFRIFLPQPGAYAIRRSTAATVVQTGYRTDADWLGFRRRVPTGQRVFAASDPIELVVKDLPAEGKPVGFAGAVGKYSVSLETDDSLVRVGDPILLKIIVSGDGLLEKIKRPILSQDPGFAKDFLANESLAPGDVSGKKVTFEQTVRAKSADVKEIPSVAFAYFDTDRGAYEVAKSKPIPVKVLPTTQVTADDVVRFGPTLPSAPTTRLEEQPGGILANYNHLDALHNQAVRWSLLSFLGLPPVVYFITLVFVSRRRKLAGNVALVRSKSARKVLKKHLAEARSHVGEDDRRFYDSLARGISRFTSDKLNLGTGELTAYDVESLAEQNKQNKMNKEISERISDILSQCDAGRFAASAQSAEGRKELLHRAEELIKTLEKTL